MAEQEKKPPEAGGTAKSLASLLQHFVHRDAEPHGAQNHVEVAPEQKTQVHFPAKELRDEKPSALARPSFAPRVRERRLKPPLRLVHVEIAERPAELGLLWLLQRKPEAVVLIEAPLG